VLAAFLQGVSTPIGLARGNERITEDTNQVLATNYLALVEALKATKRIETRSTSKSAVNVNVVTAILRNLFPRGGGMEVVPSEYRDVVQRRLPFLLKPVGKRNPADAYSEEYFFVDRSSFAQVVLDVSPHSRALLFRDSPLRPTFDGLIMEEKKNGRSSVQCVAIEAVNDTEKSVRLFTAPSSPANGWLQLWEMCTSDASDYLAGDESLISLPDLAAAVRHTFVQMNGPGLNGCIEQKDKDGNMEYFYPMPQAYIFLKDWLRNRRPGYRFLSGCVEVDNDMDLEDRFSVGPVGTYYRKTFCVFLEALESLAEQYADFSISLDDFTSAVKRSAKRDRDTIAFGTCGADALADSLALSMGCGEPAPVPSTRQKRKASSPSSSSSSSSSSAAAAAASSSARPKQGGKSPKVTFGSSAHPTQGFKRPQKGPAASQPVSHQYHNPASPMTLDDEKEEQKDGRRKKVKKSSCNNEHSDNPMDGRQGDQESDDKKEDEEEEEEDDEDE